MKAFYDLTDEQVLWLQRIFLSREDPGLLDCLTVPDSVKDALAQKGLVRRWRDGSVEITLGGIRQVSNRPLIFDDAPLVAAEPA